VLDRAVRWFANHRTRTAASISEGVEYFRDDVQALAVALPEILQGQDAVRYGQWRDEALAMGLPEDLASRRAYQFESYGLLDVVHLARKTGRSPRSVAEVYFRLYDRFDVDPVLNRITGLPRDGRWRALARAALRDDLYGLLVSFCSDILDGEGTNVDELVGQWAEDRSRSLDRAEDFLDEIRESSTDDLASLSVALRQLRAVTAH
jgi:glutamate dehydrogenase